VNWGDLVEELQSFVGQADDGDTGVGGIGFAGHDAVLDEAVEADGHGAGGEAECLHQSGLGHGVGGTGPAQGDDHPEIGGGESVAGKNRSDP
jgi:hypothetical protein